ncbi:MAG: glycosyltransferase [Planctomycetota bacterium]|nr:glycosyltransferase [Planctomycetota bacterium]
MGTVDCIIPAYKVDETLLREAIQSALDWKRVQHVIVVDDGSPRALSLETLGFAGSPRVLLIRQANAGPAAARNAGLMHASSEWVCFLDADDALITDGAEALLSLAEGMNAVGGVAGRVELDERGVRTEKLAPEAWRNSRLPKAADVFFPKAIFSTSGVIARTLPAREERFDPALVFGEDREFLYRLASRGPLAVGAAAALVQRVFASGSNLRSKANLKRWITDHATLVERLGRSAAAPHLRAQTRWLLNASAKARVDAATWRHLVACARSIGCPIPVKIRLRRILRRPPRGAGASRP